MRIHAYSWTRRIAGWLLIWPLVGIGVFATPKFVDACTLPQRIYSQFDDKEYLFIGEVVAPGGPVSMKVRRGGKTVEADSWGLKVKVLAELYLPNPITSHLEIFFPEIGADCSPEPTRKELVGDMFYPAGTRLRIIATDTGRVELPAVEGMSRLHVVSVELMSANVDPQESIKPSTSQYCGRQYTRGEGPTFALRKDFYFLSRASTDAAKVAIVEKLLGYPGLFGGNPRTSETALTKFLSTYVSDQKLSDALQGRFVENQYLCGFRKGPMP